MMPETPEERKVKDIVGEAKSKTEAIDQDNYQKPSPQPAPPGGGMFTGGQPGKKMQDEATRIYRMEAIREDALNQTAETIQGAPVGTQAKAYKIADDFAYPETASQNDPALKKKQEKNLDEAQRSAMHKLGHTDMKERTAKHKDLSQSQDFAMRNLSDKKEKNRTELPKEKGEQQFASVSQRYQMSLGVNRLSESLEKAPAKEKTDKSTMSMSGKFSASLGYNQLSDSHNPKPTMKVKESRGKEPDRD